MREQIRVTHVGNDPRGQGGIASVIRASLDLPGIQAEVLPSHRDGPRRVHFRLLLPTAARLVTRRRSRLGIVHVHLSYGGSFVREGMLLLLARLRRIPTVVTVHGSSVEKFLQRWPRLGAAVLGWGDRVLVLGENGLRAVSPLLSAERVSVVPNFVDLPPVSPKKTPRRLLFAGVVGRRKGADVLAAAFAQVVDDFPDAELIVAGPEQPDFAWPSPAPGTTILGAIPHCALLREVARSAIAVLPSRAEAMPVFLLEAMAAGCAVVATAVGDVPELVQGAGILIEPGSEMQLVEALRRLLGDPALVERLGADGRKRIQERHDKHRAAEEFRGVYAAAQQAGGAVR